MIELAKSLVRAAGNQIAAIVRPPGILPPISRGQLRSIIPADTLEIGPFDVPFLTAESVEYFDILDQEQLRRRAIEHSRNPDGCPFIHYTGKLSDVPRQFAAVFSSHTVEHTPDLIGHLEDVARLLKPGGSYFAIVPDKRYCFDHFLAESTLDQVLEARGRDRPTLEAVVNHHTRSAHNRGILHWLGLHGDVLQPNERAGREIAAARNGEYIDVHQWAFTPQSFRDIVSDFGQFHSVTVYDTPFGNFEFSVVLTIDDTG